MDKGTRVRVVKGRKHKDAVGTVFWEGPDKFREGKTRLGLHGDGGDTIWVPEDYVVVLDASDPAFVAPEPPPAPDKGARVRWGTDEDGGSGTVFWVGDGRRGARLGVHDDATGEPVWLDAADVEVVDAEDPDDVPF